MVRDFYGFRTVTDFLIAKGVGFHPETVILECDEYDDANPPVKYGDAVRGHCRPIFDHQVIEQIGKDSEGRVGRAIYVKWLPESNHMLFFSFFVRKKLIACSTAFIVTHYELETEADAKVKAAALAEENFHLELPRDVYPIIDANDMREDSIFALMVFYCIHEKFEFEEVEFPREIQRKVERRTGKKPSNHYSLRTIKSIRKQYPVKDSTSSADNNRAKAEAHLVRGHFLTQPDTHPLPQFAGKTFWVPAHQRGAGTNEKKIIYRIEL